MPLTELEKLQRRGDKLAMAELRAVRLREKAYNLLIRSAVKLRAIDRELRSIKLRKDRCVLAIQALMRRERRSKATKAGPVANAATAAVNGNAEQQE
jgi:hypothetical protein